MTITAIADGERLSISQADGEWSLCWTPAPPPERHHGSYALCVTREGDLIVIKGGGGWDGPGGRTEPGETPEETVIREVMEEACARVERARLLGYVRSECLSGARKGVVEVRSLWRVDAELLEWAPQHEILERRVVSPGEAWPLLRDANPDTARIFRRWMDEAGFAGIR